MQRLRNRLRICDSNIFVYRKVIVRNNHHFVGWRQAAFRSAAIRSSAFLFTSVTPSSTLNLLYSDGRLAINLLPSPAGTGSRVIVAMETQHINQSDRFFYRFTMVAALACWAHLAYICMARNSRPGDWVWALGLFSILSVPLVLAVKSHAFAVPTVWFTFAFLLCGFIIEMLSEDDFRIGVRTLLPLITWFALGVTVLIQLIRRKLIWAFPRLY